MLLGRNKGPGQIKQGGGPDSALGPCVYHLCAKGTALRKVREEGAKVRRVWNDSE